MSRKPVPRTLILVLKIVATVCISLYGSCAVLIALIGMLIDEYNYGVLLPLLLLLLIPTLLLLIWYRDKRKFIALGFAAYMVTLCIVIEFKAVPHWQDEAAEQAIVVDVNPNIHTDEYLPFKLRTKIVKMNDASFKLKRTDDLPIIDGATAAFPVYSAFVHAVYPRSTELYDGVFEYNNTLGGYKKLAERKTDIFFGAYPSKEQLQYAKNNGTTFEFTQVASEAFVFIVHKNNPIDSLTVEQIKGIYSGEITNWKEVGGNDEPIVAYQRDQGSGSQSMLLRFMGDTPVMDAPMTEVTGMGSLADVVSDYESRPGSIGFSFRFYIEGIIKNPDIKMIAIDGVAPTVENIKNGTYPVVTPVYAVTWAGNDNPNLQKFIDWVLSDEGQYIIEESGYVGIKK